jgi:hypothetical protein
VRAVGAGPSRDKGQGGVGKLRRCRSGGLALALISPRAVRQGWSPNNLTRASAPSCDLRGLDLSPRDARAAERWKQRRGEGMQPGGGEP